MGATGLSRRDFLRASAAVGASLAGLDCSRSERPDRPNVLFVLADDLGYEVPGCNGGRTYQTPSIDRLASQGLRFTHAYATPLCTPSRVQLMSGQYPFRNGWWDGLWEVPARRQVVDAKLIDLGQRMREAGYATAVAGKWQLCNFRYFPDHVSEAGFDEHLVWTWDYLAIGFAGGRPPRYWAPGLWHDGRLDRSYQSPEVFAPDAFTDFLIDFMRRNRERPFFAYYPMVMPHLPLVPTPDNKREYEREGGVELPFAAMVHYLDKLVGRLTDALDDLGLAERTLLVFTADNGTDSEFVSRLGDLEIRGSKDTMGWAAGHVPLIARWPGTTPTGAVCEDLTDSTDFLPTLAELCGAPLPGGRVIDGHSVAAPLRGSTGHPREWVHLQLRATRALRTRRWKLYHDGRLFDLGRDPFEENPLLPDREGAEGARARAELRRVFATLT